MEALIAREQAAAEAAAARQASISTASSSRGVKRPPPARPAQAGGGQLQSRAPPVAQADLEDDSQDEDDGAEDEDEELEEHGSAVSEPLTDPDSQPAAEANCGRRVYVEGMVSRRDLNGGGATVVAWQPDMKRWEIEMDRGDERVLVRSVNLRRLDVAPPAARPKKALPLTSSSVRAEAPGMQAKKQKKQKKFKRNKQEHQ